MLMTIVFAVLAAVPLTAALRAFADSTFRPGSFPVELMALIGVALAGVAVAWFLQSRGQHRVGGWMITFGGLFGLLLGAYGIWGTSTLMADCAAVPAVAAVASSFPMDYCERIGGSLAIGYFMIAVGIASVVSFVASAWLSRSVVNPALD
jgi:hypothetical protein